MLIPLLATVCSAVFYGVASVLQSIGARRSAAGGTVDPRLLLRVLRQGPFVAGVGLDILGFACQFYALRSLPLFLVQAALAANLAVTAVVAIPVLGVRLGQGTVAGGGRRLPRAGPAGRGGGPESVRPVSTAFAVVLLVAAALLGLLGLVAVRLPERLRGAFLGGVAGLGFAVLALAVRCLADLHPVALLRNPATYAAAVSGVVGFLFFASGLQRAAVTTVTAAVVVGETALPGGHRRTGARRPYPAGLRAAGRARLPARRRRRTRPGPLRRTRRAAEQPERVEKWGQGNTWPPGRRSGAGR